MLGRIRGLLASVFEGGTGRNTLTNHGVVIGAGTGAVNVTTAGTSGQVLTSNGASADPTFQAAGGGSSSTPATKSYSVTEASVSNSAAETDILSTSIAANDISDGDEIHIIWWSEMNNNTGSAQTVTYKGYWGGNSVTLCNAFVTSSATVGQCIRDLYIKRIGTSLYFTTGRSTANGGSTTATDFATGSSSFRGGGILTSQSFNSTTTLKFSITFPTASASLYITVLGGSQCIKTAQN